MQSQFPNPKQSASPKLRSMALKYRKYLATRKTESIKSEKQICLRKSINFAQNLFSSSWKAIIPQIIRGPSTPYQAMMEYLTDFEKSQYKQLNFSNMSISQSIQRGNLTLILATSLPLIPQTLRKLHNCQQFNLLIRNQAHIIPFLPLNRKQICSVSFKLYQLLSSKILNYEYSSEEFILVCWKGLFQEILIIDIFSLDDQDLSTKVLGSRTQRECYQNQIKKKAMEGITEDNSKVQLIERSTISTSSCQI